MVVSDVFRAFERTHFGKLVLLDVGGQGHLERDSG